MHLQYSTYTQHTHIHTYIQYVLYEHCTVRTVCAVCVCTVHAVSVHYILYTVQYLVQYLCTLRKELQLQTTVQTTVQTPDPDPDPDSDPDPDPDPNLDPNPQLRHARISTPFSISRRLLILSLFSRLTSTVCTVQYCVILAIRPIHHPILPLIDWLTWPESNPLTILTYSTVRYGTSKGAVRISSTVRGDGDAKASVSGSISAFSASSQCQQNSRAELSRADLIWVRCIMSPSRTVQYNNEKTNSQTNKHTNTPTHQTTAVSPPHRIPPLPAFGFQTQNRSMAWSTYSPVLYRTPYQVDLTGERLSHDCLPMFVQCGTTPSGSAICHPHLSRPSLAPPTMHDVDRSTHGWEGMRSLGTEWSASPRVLPVCEGEGEGESACAGSSLSGFRFQGGASWDLCWVGVGGRSDSTELYRTEELISTGTTE